jgi:hypothetical protein
MKKQSTGQIVIIVIVVVFLVLLILPTFFPARKHTARLSVLQAEGTAQEIKDRFRDICRWLERQDFEILSRDRGSDSQSVVYTGQYGEVKVEEVVVTAGEREEGEEAYAEVLVTKKEKYRDHPDLSEFLTALEARLGKKDQTRGEGG